MGSGIAERGEFEFEFYLYREKFFQEVQAARNAVGDWIVP
jgi:hypothetical protein